MLSARLRPLAAHGFGCLGAGLNLETGQLSHYYTCISEILLNVTLNQTDQKRRTVLLRHEVT